MSGRPRAETNLIVDAKFKASWKNYVLQSLLATLALLVTLLAFNLRQAAIITSIGATVFIVFAMPDRPSARPRHVIGGHLIGIISGSLLSFVPHPSPAATIVVYSLAVGLSVFLMSVTDTEHPPAAGTALSVVIDGFSFDLVLALLISVVLLALLHRLLRPLLKDLV